MRTAPLLSTRPLGDAASYFIRAGFRSRDSVEYFADETDGTMVWQPDVYPYAAVRDEQLGCDALIDIGCGRAGKLAALASTYAEWNQAAGHRVEVHVQTGDRHGSPRWLAAMLIGTIRSCGPPGPLLRALASAVTGHLQAPLREVDNSAGGNTESDQSNTRP